MSKKTIMPLLALLLVTAAGCIMMAAGSRQVAKKKVTPKPESCCEKYQNEMMIWESLGRTITTVASY